MEQRSTGIIGFRLYPAAHRLALDFPRRRRRTLLRGEDWSLEVAEHHARLFVVLDASPYLDHPAFPPRIVVFEFDSRRSRARWVQRRLETWAPEDRGPLDREQLRMSRRWVELELRTD